MNEPCNCDQALELTEKCREITKVYCKLHDIVSDLVEDENQTAFTHSFLPTVKSILLDGLQVLYKHNGGLT